MNACGERRFVHRLGLVVLEVLADDIDGEVVEEEVHALDDVALLDEDRPQDSVPGPVLVDRALGAANLEPAPYRASAGEFKKKRSAPLRFVTFVCVGGARLKAESRAPSIGPDAEEA